MTLAGPVQQAVLGRLRPTLSGLNGSTCSTVPAHLKEGLSRACTWTSTNWPGMAHKPGGLAVPAGRVGRPCRQAVEAGRAGGPYKRVVPVSCAGGPCRRAVQAGWPILNFVL